MPCNRTPVKEVWVTCESRSTQATTTVTTSTAAVISVAPLAQRDEAAVTSRGDDSENVQGQRGLTGPAKRGGAAPKKRGGTQARRGRRGVSADAVRERLVDGEHFTRARAHREGFIYQKASRSFIRQLGGTGAPGVDLASSPPSPILVRGNVGRRAPEPSGSGGEPLAVPFSNASSAGEPAGGSGGGPRLINTLGFPLFRPLGNKLAIWTLRATLGTRGDVAGPCRGRGLIHRHPLMKVWHTDIVSGMKSQISWIV